MELPKLHKVWESDELEDWMTHCVQMAGPGVITVTAEPKIDGMAVGLRYEDGRLVAAESCSMDILHRVSHIPHLPARLLCDVSLTVRGEVFMDLTRWAYTEFKNPCIGASTTLRYGDPQQFDAAGLMFTAYELDAYDGKPSLFLNRESDLALLKAAGFASVVETTTVPRAGLVDDAEIRWEIYLDDPHAGTVPVDGVVYKISERDIRDKLGMTVKGPRWALAYKFTAD